MNRHEKEFYKCLKETCTDIFNNKNNKKFEKLKKFKIYIEDDKYEKNLEKINKKCLNMIKKNEDKNVVINYIINEVEPYGKKVKGYIVDREVMRIYNKVRLKILCEGHELNRLKEYAVKHRLGEEFILDMKEYFEEKEKRKIIDYYEEDDEEENYELENLLDEFY